MEWLAGLAVILLAWLATGRRDPQMLIANVLSWGGYALAYMALSRLRAPVLMAVKEVLNTPGLILSLGTGVALWIYLNAVACEEEGR